VGAVGRCPAVPPGWAGEMPDEKSRQHLACLSGMAKPARLQVTGGPAGLRLPLPGRRILCAFVAPAGLRKHSRAHRRLPPRPGWRKIAAMHTTFTIPTNGPGLYDFTRQVAGWVQRDGLLTLLVQHTSASLLIQENADPDV